MQGFVLSDLSGNEIYIKSTVQKESIISLLQNLFSQKDTLSKYGFGEL